LWVALRQVDLESLSNAFAAVRYVPILFCAGVLSLGIRLRAVRWRVIAGSSVEQQHNFSSATNLGVLANLILPGRAGEFVRVIALARLSRTSLPQPLASAVIDRLVDVFVLLVTAAVLWWVFPISVLLGKWLTIFVVVGSAAAVLVVVYSRSTGRGEALVVEFARRWLQRWRLQPQVFVAELRAEFRRLLGSWLSTKLIALAILILCLDCSAVAILLYAFDLSLPFTAPILLWVFLAAGSSLPSAPGYVGVYQVAAVWALSFFSVSASTSVAISTTLQAVTLAVALAMVGARVFEISKYRRYS
jgi:uncharacterized protein (TIRG00374 family)